MNYRNLVALVGLALLLPCSAHAWVTTQMGRSGSCVGFNWNNTVTTLSANTPTTVAYDNSGGFYADTGSHSTLSWDDPVVGFITFGNPTDAPIQVSVGTVFASVNTACLSDGSCSPAYFFTGFVQPGDQRQVMFTLAPVDLAAVGQQAFEIMAMPAAPGLTCVGEGYWSVEHSNPSRSNK